MRLFVSALTLILGFAAPAMAAPGDMLVSDFLAKASELKARGFGAVFSSDYRMLKAQGAGALREFKAMLAAERAEGRPSSCPPRTIAVDTDVVLNHLRSYPAAMRDRIDLHQAVADYYRRTWPCRGPSLARFPR